jgi:hypothetical protein
LFIWDAALDAGGLKEDEPPTGFKSFENLLTGMALASLAFSLVTVRESNLRNLKENLLY